MTRKDAEKHLAHLARRRERYAARKKQKAMLTVSWDDEFAGRQPEVIAAFQHGIFGIGKSARVEPEVAPTPREPVQLALPLENRIAQLRPMTPEARAEMEREAKNIGRDWIRKIQSIFKEEV